jgi:hypothetical protein
MYANHIVYVDFVSKLGNFFITSSPFILFRRLLLYFEYFTLSIGELMVVIELTDVLMCIATILTRCRMR